MPSRRRWRNCPRCGGAVTADWQAGQAPSRAASVVYLYHFSRPFGHARHYGGTAVRHEERDWAHLNGNGSKLTKAARAAGIELVLVRTWPGGRTEEKQLLKSSRPGGGASTGLGRFCPLCDPNAATHKPRPGQWLLATEGSKA